MPTTKTLHYTEQGSNGQTTERAATVICEAYKLKDLVTTGCKMRFNYSH